MFQKPVVSDSLRLQVESLAKKLEDTLPELAALVAGKVEGLSVRGMTITGNDGESTLCTVRVTLADTNKYPELWDGYSNGDYVMFGGGLGLWEALAKVETELAMGRSVLCPDRYSSRPGKIAGMNPKKRVKSKPVIRE